ncbi:MAG: DUF4291 domain-containing protein [Myxococcota bacterium]
MPSRLPRADRLAWGPYLTQRDQWPATGRHILAQYDDETVIVYQAYRPEIARWAVEHQQFGGPWSFERMSWIKPNFLWMMYRCGWAQKPGQERVLAVRIDRAGFETILSQAVATSYWPDVHGPDRNAWRRLGKASPVRLQWDPDHSPTGNKLERRAIQLGLRGTATRRYALEWTREIRDITPQVIEQRSNARPARHEHLMTPLERVYVPADPAVRDRLRLDTV